ncbi:MAG: DUF480 domain-containing protein [Planctomycetota bacterium]|nr:DUF480 domain-containing protein [Planctomycetota bacterium]
MNETTPESEAPKEVKRLREMQRRILGVLMEKARTTPDAYPLSLNGLVTGCNQKSNRAPVLNLNSDQVEECLADMRSEGIVAEVHGGGRVPKYRHYGYDFLGVKGAEAGVMAELLLRGEQTVGDLRTRASRFEPIADLAALKTILKSLEDKNLVVALTAEGRGQIYTHNLYESHELEAVKQHVAAGGGGRLASSSSSSPRVSGEDLEQLKQTIADLQTQVRQLTERVTRLES